MSSLVKELLFVLSLSVVVAVAVVAVVAADVVVAAAAAAASAVVGFACCHLYFVVLLSSPSSSALLLLLLLLGFFAGCNCQLQPESVIVNWSGTCICQNIIAFMKRCGEHIGIYK